MEIIGRYAVRTISKGEKVIKVPASSNGEFILESHPGGVLIYRPVAGESKIIVSDPLGLYDSVTFANEQKAINYREKMEKTAGRAFSLKKVFSSSNNQSVIPGDNTNV